MHIMLKDLISDPLYQSATLAESIDMLTYHGIFEIYGVDSKKSYNVTEEAKGYWVFIGDSGVKHFIRINVGAKGRFELKLGFYDDNKPVYERPNLYLNDDAYQYDKKVLNTYVKALLEYVLPYFFSQLPDGELDFPAMDKARYRLYKMMVERFIKNKYEIINDDGAKNFTIKSIK